VPKWAYQTMAGGKFETTPLVVDGIMYGTGKMIARLRWMREPGGRSGIPKSAACGYSSVLRKSESWSRDFGRQVFMERSTRT